MNTCSAIYRRQGVTLVEVLLVLAIGAMILNLSIRQYLSYRRDADVQQVQYNVAMLFQAASRFFQANCDKDPMNKYFSPRSLPLLVSTLQSQGFLTEPLPLVPRIVNYSGDAPEGYIVQLNQFQVVPGPLPPRYAKVSPTLADRQIGSISAWQVQVSVNLNPNFPATALASSLGADCMSSATTGWGGNIVIPCTGGTGTFAVFQRLPSRTNSTQNTSDWLTRPALKEFKEMYSTDPITILLEPSNTAQVGAQYFVCNG